MNHEKYLTHDVNACEWLYSKILNAYADMTIGWFGGVRAKGEMDAGYVEDSCRWKYS